MSRMGDESKSGAESKSKSQPQSQSINTNENNTLRLKIQKEILGYKDSSQGTNYTTPLYVLLQSDLRIGDVKYATEKFGNDPRKVYVEVICDNGGLYIVRERLGGPLYGVIGLMYCCDEEYSSMTNNLTKTHCKMQRAGETYCSASE